MTDTTSTKPTLAELQAQLAASRAAQDALQAKIDATLKEQRGQVISQIKGLMLQHGLTVADLGSTKGGKTTKIDGAPRAKVAAKYRDLNTGDTWSGRGLKPKWLTNALAAGRHIEEFEVKAEA